MLHRMDARIGVQKVEGAELLGYAPDRGCYLTGENANRHPWMDITLTREVG